MQSKYFLLLPLFLPTATFALSSSSPIPTFLTSSTKTQQQPPFQLSRLDHIVIRCKNFPKMLDFYTNILGCTIDHADDVRRFGGALTHLRAGDAYIDLLSYDETDLTPEGRRSVLKMTSRKRNEDDPQQKPQRLSDIQFSPETSTLDHLCIRINPFEEDKMVEYFRDKGVCILSSGLRKGAEGVGPSIYIQDPEGNTIELKGPSSQPSPLDATSTDAASNALTSPASQQQKVASSNNDDQTIKQETDSNQFSQGVDSQSSTLSVTPCTRICRYNKEFYDGQVCIGCFRETYEIGTWSTMSDSERAFSLLDAADRHPGETKDFAGSISKEELLRQYRMWEERSKS